MNGSLNGGTINEPMNGGTIWQLDDNRLMAGQFEGVVAPCCNPLTLQPEQSGGRGSNPRSTFERHDKGSRIRLALSYFCDPSAWR